MSTLSVSVAIAALSTILPTPPLENVIPPPLVTILAVTRGNVPLYLISIPRLPGVTLTPKDGVPTIPIRIVGRNTFAPDIRRLRLRTTNTAALRPSISPLPAPA